MEKSPEESIKEKAYFLAMLILQSEKYQEPVIKEVVDDILALSAYLAATYAWKQKK